MDELHRRLVRHIRAQAKARDIKITHLADFAGLGRTHFFAVLGGRSSPTLRWLGAVAKALGLDASELLARRR